MKDTIIKGDGTSRKLTAPSTMPSTYTAWRTQMINGTATVDMALNEDGCDTVGTALNKASLLSDTTVSAIGVTGDNPTPDDALQKLSGNITTLQSTLTTNVSTLQSSIDATNSNVSSVQGSVDTLRCYLICLRSANWSSSAPYTQTVSVTGMTSGWVPGIPFVWDPGTVGWAKTQIDNALAYLTMIESASGSLTFYCAEDKPTSDLWIAVPGVIEWGTGWYGV